MRPHPKFLLCLVALFATEVAVLGAPPTGARPPLPKLPRDQDIDARWIYDDVTRAMAEASKSGKPLLALIR